MCRVTPGNACCARLISPPSHWVQSPPSSYLIVSAMLTCLHHSTILMFNLNLTLPDTRLLTMIFNRPLLQIKRQHSPPGSWSVRLKPRFFDPRHPPRSYRRRNCSAAQPAYDPYPPVSAHTCSLAGPRAFRSKPVLQPSRLPSFWWHLSW